MHLFYVDESGTPRGKISREEERYFTLLALGVHEFAWRSVDDSMVKLKNSFFPGHHWHDVVVHSLEIRKCRKPFDPATIPGSELTDFVTGLYSLFQPGKTVLIAVTIDKQVYDGMRSV